MSGIRRPRHARPGCVFEQLEERLLLASTTALPDVHPLASWPEQAAATDGYTVDDRSPDNWRIGAWTESSESAAVDATTSIATQTDAYFLWYLHELARGQPYDVYITWQPSSQASSDVRLWGNGLEFVSQDPSDASGVNQRVPPGDVVIDGHPWHWIGTVTRQPVTFVPYVAMYNAAGAGRMQADAVRIVPHVDTTAQIRIGGPEMWEGMEDQPLVISDLSVTGQSPDDGSREYELMLSVERGTLQWQTTTALLVVSGDTNGDRSWRVRGTVDALNTALRDLHYVAPENFHGHVPLDVTLAAVAPGHADDTASRSFLLRLIPVTDPPYLRTPFELRVDGTERTLLGQADLSAFQVGSVDTPDDPWELELRTDHGQIELPELSPLQLAGGAQASGLLIVSDTADQLNRLLQSLVYRSATAEPHTLQVTLRKAGDPVATNSVSVVPLQASRLVPLPVHLPIAAGFAFDLQTMFAVPEPEVSRSYAVAWNDGAWQTWQPSNGLWIAPNEVGGQYPLRVRMTERRLDDLRIVAVADAMVTFEYDTNVTLTGPWLVQPVPRFELQEDQSAVQYPLRQHVWGAGPLQFVVTAVHGKSGQNAPISAAMIHGTLDITTIPDGHGSAQIELAAASPTGGSIDITVDVVVAPVQDPPRVVVVGTPTYSLTEDAPETPIDLSSWFDDADVDEAEETLHWTVTSDDPTHLVARVDQTTRQLYLSPQPDAYGTFELTVQAHDPEGNTASATVSVEIIPLADPTIVVETMPDLALPEDSRDVWIPLDRYFRDADVDVPTSSMIYQVIQSPDSPLSASVVRDFGNAQYLVLHPLRDAVGTAQVQVIASDPMGGASAADLFTVDVYAVNDAPQLIAPIPDQGSLPPGATRTVDLLPHFIDVENDPLTFQATLRGDSIFSQVTIDGETMQFTLVGDYERPWDSVGYIVVRANDGHSSMSHAFAVHMDAAVVPVIHGAEEELVFDVVANASFSYLLTADGSDPQSWLLLDGHPTGMEINASTGLLSWNPGPSGPGNYLATVLVEMGGLSYWRTLVFRVREESLLDEVYLQGINRGSFVDDLRFLVQEEQQITLNVEASGTFPNEIEFELLSGPGSITPTGRYTWTPDDSHAEGTNPLEYVVTVRAFHGTAQDIDSFVVMVTEKNYPPAVTAPDAMFFDLNDVVDVTLDRFVAQETVAPDSGADEPYRYALASSFAGASINEATGVVTWQPQLEARYLGPRTQGVRVRATDEDGAGSYALSHVVIAGEICAATFCRPVWAPLARDLDVEIFPGGRVTIDLLESGLIEDPDGLASDLVLGQVQSLSQILQVTEVGPAAIEVFSPAAAGGGGARIIEYDVRDLDNLTSNMGRITVHITDVRIDIDADLDQNGLIETTDADLWDGHDWNDDWYEELGVPAAVYIGAAPTRLPWEIEAGDPSAAYEVELFADGFGQVQLLDVNGEAVPWDAPVTASGQAGTWFARGIAPGQVALYVSLLLEGEEIHSDLLSLDVLVPSGNVIELDLDIDSDNDSDFGLPSESAAEDAVETTAPGKWLPVGVDDRNDNGLPPRVEGYGFVTPDPTVEVSPMVPMTLKVVGLVPDGARIVFKYDDAAPERVSLHGPELGEAGRLPEAEYYDPGRLRIWTNSSANRNSTPISVDPQGHFVPAGEFAFSDFTWQWDGQEFRTVLYVEAVDVSTTALEIDARLLLDDSPGAVFEDRVLVSPLETDLDMDSDNDGIIGTGDLEDPLEHWSSLVWPGHYVAGHSGDRDGDLIVDTQDFMGQGNLSASPPFARLQFAARGELAGAPAVVRFRYDADDPATPQQEGTMRVWLRDGTEDRSPQSILLGGDFVPGDASEFSLMQLGGAAVTLYVEALAPFSNTQIEVEIDPDGDGPVPFLTRDRVFVRTIRVDLDIDSDNQDGLERTLREDYLEAEHGTYGKLLLVDADDRDRDGVPGFAEGLLGIARDETIDTWSAAKVQLELSGLPRDALVRFVYADSNPAIVQFSPDPSLPWSADSGVAIEAGQTVFDSHGNYSLPPGFLRLWREPLEQARNPSPVKTGGDFLPSDVPFRVDELWAALQNSQDLYTLWLEGVRPSSTPLSILLQVDVDGERGLAAWETFDEIVVSPVQLTLTADPIAEYESHDDRIVPLLADAPGLVVPVNDGDLDEDGAPDFADGIDLWGQFADAASARFRRVDLVFQGPSLVRDDWRLQLLYPAADPAAVTRLAAPAPFDVSYDAGTSGTSRVWTRDGLLPRHVADLLAGGDYVSPHSMYAWTTLASQESQATFFLEGIAPSVAPAVDEIAVHLLRQVDGDGYYTYRPDVATSLAELPSVGDRRSVEALDFTIVQVDLDIDTDQNTLISQDRHEDQFESYRGTGVNASQFPGQRIILSTGDEDGDGIRDTSDFTGQDGHSPSAPFMRLPLRMADPIDRMHATVRFEYPTIPMGQNEATGNTGLIRLWTKDGNVNRDPAPAHRGGDYLAPGLDYEVKQFSTSDTIELFVEGLAASHAWGDVLLKVSVDPDGPTGRFPSFLLSAPDPPQPEIGRASALVTDAVRLTVEAAQTVHLIATDRIASEYWAEGGLDGDFAEFTFSRGESHTTGDLRVDFRVDGSASASADFGHDFVWSSDAEYTYVPGTATGWITIPHGQSSAVLRVVPLNDMEIEWDEAVQVVLLPPDATTTGTEIRQYRLGSSAADKVRILDNDGYHTVFDQNADLVSNGETRSAIVDDRIQVDLQDARIQLTEVPGLTSWHPTFVGNEGTSPVIAVDLEIPPIAAGDRMLVDLHFGPLEVVRREYSQAESSDGPWRLGIPVDARQLPTGQYDYDVQVRWMQGAVELGVKTIRGHWAVQNLLDSAAGDNQFGDGWWVTDLDRAAWTDGQLPAAPTPPNVDINETTYRLVAEGAGTSRGVSLLRGDQSAAWYRLPGTGMQLAKVVDSRPGSTSYQETAGNPTDWQFGTNAGGYGSTYRVASESAAAGAMWLLDGMSEGVYQLLTTWTPDIDRDPDAMFVVHGAERVDGPPGATSWSVQVDQRRTPAADILDGLAWKSLGFVRLSQSDNLQITLQGSGTGRLVADAVALARPAGDDAFRTPLGSFSQLRYDGNGLSLWDKWGGTQRFDAIGQLRQSEDRNGNVTSFEYLDADADGRQDELASVVDPFGVATEYLYQNGRLSEVIDIADRVTVYAGTNVRTVTLPNPGFGQPNVVWAVETDAQGRLVRVVDPLNVATWISYTDGSPRATSFRTAAGTAEASTWSVISLAARAVELSGRPRATPEMLTASYVDGRDHQWHYETDTFGYVTARTNPLPFGDTWLWERNDHGLVERMIEPAGAGGIVPLDDLVTQYGYDLRGNRIREVYADQQFVTREYEPRTSQLVSQRDSLGRSARYQLDPHGNVELIEEVNRGYESRFTSYAYTPPPQSPADLPGGLMTRATVAALSPDAVTTRYEYYSDPPRRGLLATRIEALDTAFERSVSWLYDDLRLPATETHFATLQGDRVYDYRHDQLSRLVEETGPHPHSLDHGRPVTGRRYDAMGNLTQIVSPNGSVTRYEYDARGRLQREIYPAPGGAAPSDQAPLTFTYRYDANSQLVGRSDGRGETLWDYDQRGLVVHMIEPAPNVAGALHEAPVTTYEYDSAGNLKSTRDARSHGSGDVYFTTYAYDTRHRLTETRRPDPGTSDHGETTLITRYDAVGRVVAEEQPAAAGIARTRYIYDDLNRLRFVISPETAAGTPVTEYRYDLRDNVTASVDPLGRVSTYAYDMFDRLTDEFLPSTGITSGAIHWHQEYWEFGELRTRTLSSSLAGSGIREWEYQYDGLGRLTHAMQPDPQVAGEARWSADYHYDVNGNPTQFVEYIDGAVHVTTTEYDGRDRPWRVVGPLDDGIATETITVYDRWDQVTQLHERMEGGTFRVTDFVYDQLGRLVTVMQPAADEQSDRATMQYRHDSAGNVRRVTDASGRLTESFYDRLNRLRTRSEPLDGNSLYPPASNGPVPDTRDTDYRYFPNDAVSTVYDALDGVSSWEYDAAGRVTSQTDPNGDRVVFRYDLYGNLVQLIDAVGNATHYGYDALNRQVTEVVRANGAILARSQSYGPLGDLVSTTDRNGRQIAYAHDGVGRVIREEWVADPQDYVAEYRYTARGELRQASDITSSYQWGYHAGGAVTSQDLSLALLPNQPFHIQYGLDPLLQRTSMTVQVTGQTDYVTHYERDDLGRVREVQHLNANEVHVVPKFIAMQYLPDGRLSTMTRETRTTAGQQTVGYSEFEYYSDGMLSSIVHRSAIPGEQWNAMDFGYDAKGRITSLSSGQFGQQVFGYDARDQLREVDRAASLPDDEFSYDANGNPLGTVEDLNRLREDRAGRYLYDREGNVLERWRFEPHATLTINPHAPTAFDAPPLDVPRGWYRVRLDEVLLEQSSGLGDSVLVRVGYATDPVDARIGIRHNFEQLTMAERDVDAISLGVVRIVDGYVDLYVPDNLLNVYPVVYLGSTADATLAQVLGGTVGWEQLTEVQRFAWDYRNRLMGAQVYGPDVAGLPGSVPLTNPRDPSPEVMGYLKHDVEYRYDVLNQRVARLFHESAQYESEVYLNVEGHALADYSLDGTLQKRYVYGPAVDQLLAVEIIDAMGQVETIVWPLVDHLQTVTQLVVQDVGSTLEPQVVDIAYDAFGLPQHESSSLSLVRARYTGRDFDPETQLSYHRARYLMVDAGRWMSEDDAWLSAGDANRYRYAGNRPMDQRDPSGSVACGGICIAALLYVGRSAALSLIETGVEGTVAYGLGDDQFSPRHALTRNFAVNLAIGWIPGIAESKIGLRGAAWGSRLGTGLATRTAVNFGTHVAVGTAGDAAWSIGVEEQPWSAGATQALVGNLVGQGISGALASAGRRPLSAAWTRLHAYSGGFVDGATRPTGSVYVGSLLGGAGDVGERLAAGHAAGKVSVGGSGFRGLTRVRLFAVEV